MNETQAKNFKLNEERDRVNEISSDYQERISSIEEQYQETLTSLEDHLKYRDAAAQTDENHTDKSENQINPHGLSHILAPPMPNTN